MSIIKDNGIVSMTLELSVPLSLILHCMRVLSSLHHLGHSIRVGPIRMPLSVLVVSSGKANGGKTVSELQMKSSEVYLNRIGPTSRRLG